MGVLSSLFKKRSPRGDESSPLRELLRPGREDALLKTAKQLHDRGQNERALDLLIAGTRRFPDNAVIAEHARAVEAAVAKQTLRQRVARLNTDDSAELRAELSDLYRRTGQLEEAILSGRHAIQMAPESALGYSAVGRVYFDRFVEGQASIDGMNALRYLTKAHSLAPSNSLCLMQLSEIFVVLRAPRAASRFLTPVLRAFGDDPLVQDLASKIDALPAEETTHIQDLFLRHERVLRGESPEVPASGVRIDTRVAAEIEERARAVPGTEGLYLIGSDRGIVCGFNANRWPENDLGEAFGLVADTVRENANRMGIGEFKQVTVRYPSRVVSVQSVGSDVTAFYFGNEKVRNADAESLLSKIGDALEGSSVA
ncbi:MAG: tetratricopeptide repeat protein [Planctomycetota bacterium]